MPQGAIDWVYCMLIVGNKSIKLKLMCLYRHSACLLKQKMSHEISFSKRLDRG